MAYIEITEWDRFQHYKHRNPPWIKLYSKLLDDDEFDCLPDDSKLLFFCLILFASRKKNHINLNFKWLQKKLPIRKKITNGTLQPLVDAGFISCYKNDSKVIAECKQNALPEKSRVETEKRREEQMSLFDEARKLFKGTKLGLETEYENFHKKHADWKTVLPLLKPAVEQQIKWREQDERYWKNFKTWINNRCWEEEGETKPDMFASMEQKVKEGRI